MAKCYNRIYLKDKNIEVDCGKCLNCIENRKQEAATRMMLEIGEGYINKYFITLTYDPLYAEYDENGLTMLNQNHIKTYVKALQYIQKRHYGEGYKLNRNKLKYIMCGEYGENNTKRAHYHMVIATNIFIERYLKAKWKYGQVKIERLKDARGIAYTSGYTNKKFGHKEKERERQPFVKWSVGLGKDWIHKQLIAKKIDHTNYHIKTVLGCKRMPAYFKRKIKANIMGVEPKYRKLSELERQFRKEHFGEDRKTIMINQNLYDENVWKWERFIEKLKVEIKKFDLLYLKYDEMNKIYGDNWKKRIFNLMYNEKWDEMDEVEKRFTELKIKENELLRIKAESKMFRRKLRSKIA